MMSRVVALFLLVLSGSLVTVSAATSYINTCQRIAGAISLASDVYYPDSQEYSRDIEHFMSSSTQDAACSVEPGTAADVGTILQIIGSTRTPFAVKSGGHTGNPGFSSTTGVQIAMSRFSEVTYDPIAETATIGAGQIWDDVYSALEPYGVSVAGARVTGIGVAGFILGGGYSWKTNQYGLAIDNVQAFQLVLPNGTITTVTDTSDADLFFGLRGGFNNFGIVTTFVMKALPQTDVWGGLITCLDPSNTTLDAITAATNKFSDNNTDPKAGIITAYNSGLDVPVANILVFYDAPSAPPGLFDDFLTLPGLCVPDVYTRSLTSLTAISIYNATAGSRGIFNTVSLTGYSIDMLNFIVQELQNSTTVLGDLDLTFLSYDIEPFLPSLLSHSTIPSAYPPTRSQAFLLLNIYFAWWNPLLDGAFHEVIRTSAASIKAKAIAEGQDVANASVYGNYASFTTPLKDIYGQNVGRLESITQQNDPYDVMGLAGGFKL